MHNSIHSKLARTLTGGFVVGVALATPSLATEVHVGKTWSNKNSLLIAPALKKNLSGQSAKPNRGAASALTFKSVGDSGVAKSLADALGSSAQEKATLKTAFGQIKQAYESEVSKEKKSNDLAAAMTFFIAANVTAYNQTSEPSDKATDDLYVGLQRTMSGIPEITKMPDAAKQQFHDWLVIMGGFVLGGYMQAKESGDEAGLKNFKEVADNALRAMLGVDASQFSFSPNTLSIVSSAPPTEANATSQLVGVWSKAASSPAGTSMGTHVGYAKQRYIFAPNGGYSFKGERWGGYTNNTYWTIEENGIYTVQGNALILTPKVSKLTIRGQNGKVKQTQSNPLEKVSYKWKMHYFEGLNENQLVLQPQAATKRDGGFSMSSLFPNSYLYSNSGAPLEFRY